MFFRVSAEDRSRGIMVVDVMTDVTFARSPPRVLFDSRQFAGSTPVRSYDVAPDGQRFVMRTDDTFAPEPVTSVNLVLSWFEELTARVPVP